MAMSFTLAEKYEVGESMTMVIQRFLDSGLSTQETADRMGISIEDLETLMHS